MTSAGQHQLASSIHFTGRWRGLPCETLRDAEFLEQKEERNGGYRKIYRLRKTSSTTSPVNDELKNNDERVEEAQGSISILKCPTFILTIGFQPPDITSFRVDRVNG